MNLVQINERLKDMPLRAVEMYANGSNPQIPPYLALAELQRREKFAQQAAMEQGAAQGPMPSIKEQIERKVGLMALQQGRMQQGQQQMADQATRMPMSVPQNVEPAEEQPQAEDSGIAKLPVKNDMYQFANGGIIAFAAGGASNFEQRRAEERRRIAYERELAERQARQEAEAKGLASADAAAMDIYPSNVQVTAPPAAPVRNVPTRPSANVQARAAEPSPDVAQPQPSRVAVPPAPTPKLPDIFTDPTYMDVVRQSLKQQTPQELFQQQQELLKMQGVIGPAAVEQERRAKERQAEYESRRPTGLQDLIRVLGQAGQYKGMSGIAPAYTSLQQQRRAEDLRFREEQDRLLDAIEEKRRQEAIGRAGAIREDIFKGKDVAARTAGQLTSEQMRALAELTKQTMSDQAARDLTDLKFKYEMRLKAIPQAKVPELKEQYVADLVKNGMPRSQAIEAAMRLGVGEEGVDVKALKNMQDIAMKTIDPLSGATPEQREAARAQLAKVNQRLTEISGMGGGRFTVVADGKTYTFPTQEAANKFKAEAGVK